MVRLGFNEAAADEIYGGQGIDSIEEWENFDEADVKSLCRTVRKPGGGGDGEMISYKAEMNLQLAVFFIHHKHRTSRTVDYADITVPKIRALKKQREVEALKESKPELPTIDLKDVSKTYEAMVQYLRGMRGGSGVPLSYVARPTNELIPKPSDEDPSTGYGTHDEEMVKRAPIIKTGSMNGTEQDGPFDDTFMGDSGKVWDLISPLLITTEAWPHVKSARKSRNGRKAMLAFHDHFLGPNNISHIQKQAESKLLTLTYQGERKNWNFERFVTSHKEQHTILESLTDHGYPGMNARTKVDRLIDGITTDSLDAVKSNILGNEDLRSNFEKCVTLYKDFIKQSGSGRSDNRRVAEVRSKGGSGDNDDVEDRYYSKEEYKKLPSSAKLKLKRLREGRSEGRSEKKRGPTSEPRKKIKKLERQRLKDQRTIKKLRSQLKMDETDNGSAESSDESEEEMITNRNHSALTRQSKGKGKRRSGKRE